MKKFSQLINESVSKKSPDDIRERKPSRFFNIVNNHIIIINHTLYRIITFNLIKYHKKNIITNGSC